MSAQVEEVEGAEQAGDLDEVHIARGADEDGDVVDLGSVKVKPHVGDGVDGLCAGGGSGVRVDEVLPAGGVVGGDDGAHGFRGVEGGAGVVVGVYGDAVERGGGVLDLRATVVDVAAGEVEHGAVEGDGEVGSGLVGHLVEGLGDSRGLLGVSEWSYERESG